MAIYTTLFTASDVELNELFPGWRLPQPTRQSRIWSDLASGYTTTIQTWDPDPSPAGKEPATLYDPRGRTIQAPMWTPSDGDNKYVRYLEEISPGLLRTLPHFATKGISHFELEELGATLVGDNIAPARFIDCRVEEGIIGAVQAEALPSIAGLSDEQLPGYAVRWQKRLGAERADGLLLVLTPIRLLARDAVERHANLYSHARV